MKKGNLSNWILILIFFTGLSLLLYPTFSEFWNARVASYAVSGYVQHVSAMDNDRYAEIWNQAQQFNDSLLARENPYYLPEELETIYHQRLNPGEVGIMGYVEIPKIDVSLPIYHGTDESVLQVAVGHLEWTSLPIGGPDTHSVISGHRGLPSARLFTDLNQMEVGDTFRLYILDEVLEYEVDQILIVEPDEAGELTVVPGRDLCTLVTCTPYGINSHRLLVRGTRVLPDDQEVPVRQIRVTADAALVEPYLVAVTMAVPVLLILMMILLIPNRRTNRRRSK